MLNNHKYLWNDARTSVTLSKVEHNRQQFIANPDQVQEEGGHPPIPHNPFKRTLSGVMSGVDVEAIAQELVAKKAPLLREKSCSSLSISRIRDSTKQRTSGAALSSLAPISAWRDHPPGSSCLSWPWSIKAIARYITQRVPGGVFTSFAILRTWLSS